MLGKIMKKILGSRGDRSSCCCNVCTEMCETPCWPAPAEALRLLAHGFMYSLQINSWICDGVVVEALTPRRTVAGFCIFFKNSLCQLHDQGLKPEEGRLAHHSNSYSDAIAIRDDLARRWKLHHNMIRNFRMGRFDIEIAETVDDTQSCFK